MFYNFFTYVCCLIIIVTGGGGGFPGGGSVIDDSRTCYAPEDPNNEHAFTNFCNGYLANLKASRDNNSAANWKQYYSGIINGFHAKMTEYKLERGAAYNGSN